MTKLVELPLTRNIRPGQEPPDLREYEKSGGYQAARKALSKMAPGEITSSVSDSNLRGRGGGGFPTGKKWSLMPPAERDARRPRYIICNSDEMEPGAFKDRALMEGDPHQLIEGMIIGSFALQAEVAYIFVRLEYRRSAERLRKAIAEAYDNNYLGKNIFGSAHSLDLHLHVSAGRYMCGEETGLLNALEGKRAIPRAKPPYATTVGLWGNPTVINNTETWCNIPHIVNNGAAWFRSLSRTEDGGTKIYGMSGRVKKPSSWELPMGTTLREILEVHAGGMQDGYRFRGVIPGGASTDFLVEEHLDVKMDFTYPEKAGSRLGTGTMLVLDDRTCPVGMVLNFERFFARESCGWCTPCREGLPWVETILQGIEEGRGQTEDIDILEEQTQLLGPGRTFCALAPGAMEPLASALKYFREDFEQHIRDGRCPWR
jgi:NADH-quinone oxidoreductase subunit F